ncbi:MAG TPA: DUF6544 family protein [Bryobacteraceae bacterium]|nr:DUF6544 family protein [Bryobacteraceae bacterium]
MLSFIVCSLAAIVLAPLGGRYLFRRRVARDVTTLLSTTMSSVGPQQLVARRDSLPEPVQRYLHFAIEVGALATRTVRLEHGGTFRAKPEQRWLPIRGVEYFTAATPGFVWSASIHPAPLMWIDARDRLHNRRGNMLVKLESLFTIADAGGPEIDQGASLRWLAEAVWFPYAFAGDAIRWQPVSGGAARATLVQNGAPVVATLEFDAEGRVVLIRGERYRDVGGSEPVLTPWLGRCSGYRKFGRFHVPAHVEVAWVVDGVEFAYARFDVTAIDYNVAG